MNECPHTNICACEPEIRKMVSANNSQIHKTVDDLVFAHS